MTNSRAFHIMWSQGDFTITEHAPKVYRREYNPAATWVGKCYSEAQAEENCKLLTAAAELLSKCTTAGGEIRLAVPCEEDVFQSSTAFDI